MEQPPWSHTGFGFDNANSLDDAGTPEKRWRLEGLGDSVKVAPETPDSLRVFLGKYLPERLAYDRNEREVSKLYGMLPYKY